MPGVIPGNPDRSELGWRAIAGAHEHGNFRGDNVQKSATKKATLILVTRHRLDCTPEDKFVMA
jgi:hypothetical protein